MFCPRCGTGVEDGLKYCRNCGLPVAPITSYVASGGTKELTLANATPPPLTRLGFTLKQVMVLRIAASLLLPAVVAILASVQHWPDEAVGMAALLAPFLILLSIFRYRALAMQLPKSQSAPLPQAVVSAPLPPPALVTPKNTNPLNPAPISVIEDETVRLPEKQS